ncbi:Rid family hydrolase [Actinoplanes sp. NPDC051861]|uniref:RidA family protein n=1 Tax=Actinoplanes sp. NPDC051861 TaxID=3155170 RepID=UPI003441E204
MTTYLPAVPGYEHLGVPPGDIVHLTEYVTSAAPNLDRRRTAVLGDHFAPVSRVPVESIVGTGSPYAVAAVTHPGGGELLADGVRIADGVVYLPSVHTAEGDFREQYRWCLQRVADLLAAAGLDAGALVRTVDYTATATRAEYPRCGRPRRELLPGPVFPGAAGILVDVPVAPGAQVSLDAVAATGPLEVINPGWKRYDTLTYQPAVRAGNTIFLAGFGALDPETQAAVHPGDLAAQAEFIYRAIDTVLASTGADVVHMVEYLTPAAAASYPATRELRAAHFPNAVVTPVVCSALLRPEFLLETVPTAVIA